MRQIMLFGFITLLAGCGDAFSVADMNQNNNQENHNENNANGNTVPGVCGDGNINTGEQCDDGEANSASVPNACRPDCRLPYCEDTVVDSDEECDLADLAGATCTSLGYTKGNLTCGSDCTFDVSDCSTCGNGEAEGTDTTAAGYEVCDGNDLRNQNCISVGQAQGVLACAADCTWDVSGCTGGGPSCGNGVVESGEECDDGNNDLFDECPDGPAGTCQYARCGDGFTYAGVELCDDGNNLNEDSCPDGINGTCIPAFCGDGHVHIGVEVCDHASDPYCNPDCQTYCGDGTRQQQYGEECDDGNNVDGDGCYSDCSGYCGDWVVHDGVQAPDHGEDCDHWDYSLCDPDCTFVVCGDQYCNTVAGEDWATCPGDCPCVTVQNGPVGTQHCGTCGNNCTMLEYCTLGQCVSQ